MVGELLGLAAQLVALPRVHRLRERNEARGAGLERTSAAERVGLVRDTAARDGLAVQPVADQIFTEKPA